VAQLFKSKLHSLTVTILHVSWQYRSCDSSISILNRLQPRELGFDCRKSADFSFQHGKWPPAQEADQSPPSSAKLNNVYSWIAILPLPSTSTKQGA